VWDQRRQALFTPEQNKLFQNLTGEPFTGRLHPLSNPFGGGFGGFGGGFTPGGLALFAPPR
jgi:hypothetical protein